MFPKYQLFLRHYKINEVKPNKRAMFAPNCSPEDMVHMNEVHYQFIPTDIL
jgi:hypothetical protein